MKISKRYLKIISITFYLGIIFGIVAFVIYKCNSYWNDEATWSVSNRLVLPSQKSKVRMTVNGSLLDGEFTVDLPYCQIYTITSSQTSVSLYCSLLSDIYRIERPDTIEALMRDPDVRLTITKEDPLPDTYFGRQRKTFDSLSYFGSTSELVSLHVSGNAQKPKKTISAVINHAVKAVNHEVQQIPVTLSEWSVTPLSSVSNEVKSEYVKNWKNDMQKRISSEITQKMATANSPANKLNAMRDFYRQQTVICVNLTDCTYKGEMNPAEPIMYYLYTARITNPDHFASYTKLVTENMFPFVAKRSDNPTGCVGEDCPKDWVEMYATYFPVCPVNDLLNTTQSPEYKQLFVKYVESKTKKTISFTDAQAIAVLDKYAHATQRIDTDEYSSLAADLNNVCYFLLKDGPQKHASVTKKYIELYESILSELLNTPTKLTKDSIYNAIFTSSAYSAYNETYLLDRLITQNIQKFGTVATDSAVSNHTENHFVLGSMLLLYLAYGYSD